MPETIIHLPEGLGQLPETKRQLPERFGHLPGAERQHPRRSGQHATPIRNITLGIFKLKDTD